MQSEKSLRALSLFTGCGGFDLAAESAGIEIVGQCEIDKDCNKVLLQRGRTAAGGDTVPSNSGGTQ